jgi:hypothetical protein
VHRCAKASPWVARGSLFEASVTACRPLGRPVSSGSLRPGPGTNLPVAHQLSGLSFCLPAGFQPLPRTGFGPCLRMPVRPRPSPHPLGFGPALRPTARFRCLARIPTMTRQGYWSLKVDIRLRRHACAARRPGVTASVASPRSEGSGAASTRVEHEGWPIDQRLSSGQASVRRTADRRAESRRGVL